MQQLRGKTALITGGATGIGRALAMELASEGMAIVIASTSRERLEKAADEIRVTGANVRAIQCDVADRASVRALAAEAGDIDLLCANAGVTTSGPYLDHRDEDYDWTFGVVLNGVTNCIQAFYPAMAARGSGHIMITGSQTAFIPDWVFGHGPYVAAKGAVHALAFALRPEAAEHGVGVTLLVPASTETEIALCERARPAHLGAATKGPMSRNPNLPPPLPGHAFRLSSSEVAKRAVAGLKANAPLVVSHACMKPLVEDYFNRVLKAYDQAAVSA